MHPYYEKDQKIIMSYPVNNRISVVKVIGGYGDTFYQIMENVGNKQMLWIDWPEFYATLPNAYNAALKEINK